MDILHPTKLRRKGSHAPTPAQIRRARQLTRRIYTLDTARDALRRAAMVASEAGRRLGV